MPKNVCVIGAGTMGSGIAAHLANLGFQVSLLDLTPESTRAAFERATKARPPHFFVPETAHQIRLGSIRDDLNWVSEADWVCEAIIEKLDAKQNLFAQIDPLLRPDAMISTNTSGLQISLLSEGRSESFRRRFLGTHFFNPPRYLKLLELIPTPETDPNEVRKITQFLEDEAARRVVLAKDTPGFIANRFGMWAMIHAIHVAEKLQLTVEQVDAICGPFLGRPRSAAFRLNDIVGLDIMEDIARNLRERCPEDPYRGSLEPPKSLATLLERGWIGEKSGQGYYRREGKELMALDLHTMAYRQRQDAQFASLDALAKRPLGERLAEALEGRDEVGDFLREHLIPVLQYADYLKAEVSHNVQDFDRVMMWGFGWETGPFAMIDAIGASRLGMDIPTYYLGDQMHAYAGGIQPIRQEPEYQPLTNYPLEKQGEGFNVRDLGDGVKALSLTSKMGVLHPSLIRTLLQEVSQLSEPFLLTSEARSFSAGFDLKYVLDVVERSAWEELDENLKVLQDLADLLATRRCVAAIFGHCLGAGFEIATGCPMIVAHPDTQIGLPEAKVGLIPGGSGTARLRLRHGSTAKAALDIVTRLTQGLVAANADEARKLGYLRPTDVTAYHPDRLIWDAKKLLQSKPPQSEEVWSPTPGPLAGMIDNKQEELKAKGEFSDYDETIGDSIKQVFCKVADYEEAKVREREVFLNLVRSAPTHSRIRHMLETGKPLKN
ncbi:MAG TPA: 3-hydroxyacyl-CoA dehydrogenase/enoyl-CoA hydratase family protein [Fimbriimonadaceae bacterium]|nr:3-hydroxyacyl-CoA dehydrogenase/enoyl-CoA hydratase family protein [Fimbriimonadaceae bacterium]HRJ32790.1 3-hydroxyacyl-CoA dehydrogenase/enoyl-CoA hydratase family protein [Fimbriimonadaceae bacterium]